MKNLKKNLSMKNIDPFVEATKNKKYEEYSSEADLKIRIAEEIYAMRKLNNISQQKLAELAGTTQRIISCLENAELNPGAFLLFKIFKVLNFTSHNVAKIYNRPDILVISNGSSCDNKFESVVGDDSTIFDSIIYNK